MTQIVHLSDLHLRSSNKPNMTSELSYSNRKVEALVRRIDQHFPHAHVVVTGDVTDSGTPTSVEAAYAILEPWLRPDRLSVVPGNHDCGTKGGVWIPGRKRNLIARFARSTPQKYPWVKMLGNIVLIGLDSTADTPGQLDEQSLLGDRRYRELLTPIERALLLTARNSIVQLAIPLLARAARRIQFAVGRLGDDQLFKLAQILVAPEMRKRIPVVIMHHHPRVHEKVKGKFISLADSKALMNILEGQTTGKAVTVLFGHRHHQDSWEEGGTRFVAAPSSVEVFQGVLRFRTLNFNENGFVSEEWHTMPWDEITGRTQSWAKSLS